MNSERAYNLLRRCLRFAAFAGALILCPEMQSADFPEFHVEPALGARIRVLPGEVITTGIRISSNGVTPARCLLVVDAPPRWKVLLPDEVFDAQPGASEVRLISFRVPAQTATGPYDVPVLLKELDTGRELGQAVLHLDVLPSRKLSLVPAYVPRTSVAGVAYTATFRLLNNSNEAGRVAVKVRNTPPFPVELDTVNLFLHAGEEREIHVTVHAEQIHGTRYRHALEMIAYFPADPRTEARASGLVTVIPTRTVFEETITFPLQLTFRNTGENGVSGSQAELFGVGSFTESGSNRYEILLRGPDNRTQSLLGQRDEYRFVYESAFLELTVGDQPFRLTPLTELGRYAVGASVRGQIEQFSVGGFINRTRWSPAKAEQAAGFVSYRANPDVSIGANFLQKRDSRTADILTVQSELGIAEQADAFVEFGGSRSANERGNGLAVQLRSRPGWIQYGVNLIHAEPGYRGYYRDFDARSASLALFPWDKLRFEGYYSDEKRNLDRDPVQLHAPQNRRLQIGVGFGHHTAVYYKVVRHRDLLPGPKYDREERSVVLNFGAYYQNGSLNANIDVGRTEELILNRSYPLRRFSLSARFQPDTDQGYSTSIEYGSTKDLFTNQIREGTSWNISAWFRPFRPLQFHAGVYQSWTIAPTRQRNLLADAGFDLALPFGHVLSAMGRINAITSTIEQDNIAYSVEYTVPLNISLSNEIEGGEIAGIVYDENTRRGIADIVVYAGEAVAITDDDGRFEFPTIREGTYAVSIDRGGIGPGRITTIPLPIEVPVYPDQRRVLEVGVTHSGSIRGILRNAEGQEENQQGRYARTPSGGDLRGVTIEVRREGEVFRRITDARGRFDFSDLRPGTWTLTVLEEGIPEGLGVTGPSRTIELLPGELREIPIDLIPLQRRIRMLQEGTLLRAE